ncbi:hypothetical protein ACOACO_03730 [Nocardioides sp. CPCC 205120]|uniref:hypothetical protein n=1 Tax=Nocardioides sp. CPCC 205120 TaxID=3406462 RepID=UPI003B50B821
MTSADPPTFYYLGDRRDRRPVGAVRAINLPTTRGPWGKRQTRVDSYLQIVVAPPFDTSLAQFEEQYVFAVPADELDGFEIDHIWPTHVDRWILLRDAPGTDLYSAREWFESLPYPG